MNRMLIMSLGEEGLHLFIDSRSKEAENLNRWTALSSSEFGKFLVGELKKELSLVRRMYRRLPVANHDAVGALLAGLQGKEEDIDLWLQKLDPANEYKKTLDMEVAFAVECLQKRKAERARGQNSILSEAAQEQLKGDSNG